jgi:hypothetical protein
LWGVALFGAVLGFFIKRALGTAHPIPLAVVVLGLYSFVYGAGAYALGIDEARSTVATARRRLLRR